jgi:hypothetical protein
MMDVYDQRLDDVLDLIRQARIRAWWKDYGISDKSYIAFETAARRASSFELSLVPGLLQTADFARALFEAHQPHRPSEWIAKRVAARMTRQERLTDEDHPLDLDAVVHEFAIRRVVGGPKVMRAQLRQLALITELPTVSLRILPASVVASGVDGGFTILDFALAGQPSVLHLGHAFGSLRQDKSEDVEPARLAFANLRSRALGPDESVELIERVADELRSS